MAYYSLSALHPPNLEKISVSYCSFRSLSKHAPNVLKNVDLTVDAAGKHVPSLETNPGTGNLTAVEAGAYVLEHVPDTWQVGIANH